MTKGWHNIRHAKWFLKLKAAIKHRVEGRDFRVYLLKHIFRSDIVQGITVDYIVRYISPSGVIDLR